jgi:molecular chaperone Hsp33
MESSAVAGNLLSFLLADKSVRGVILHGTKLVEEMRSSHELGGLETLLLGQALQVTVLMASTLKGQDEIGLRIDCAGPTKGLVTEATASGEVRGYLQKNPMPPAASLAALDDTNNLKPCRGDGLLTVTRIAGHNKQAFRGSITLQSGHIASEVARYYLLSEQIPTAIHLSLCFDSHDRLTGAGGLLLQALPGASASIFAQLEQITNNLPSLGQALAEGKQLEPWLNRRFAHFQPAVLATRSVHFRCRCSNQQMHVLLYQLPLADLEEMQTNGPFPIELNCHFCNKKYLFTQIDLATISTAKQAGN